MDIMVDYFPFVTSKIIKHSLNGHETNQINVLIYFLQHSLHSMTCFKILSHNNPFPWKVFPTAHNT